MKQKGILASKKNNYPHPLHNVVCPEHNIRLKKIANSINRNSIIYLRNVEYASNDTFTIGEFKDSDLLDIQSAKIIKNTLFLVVTYSGGCAEHKFSFIGSPMIMKSLPPKRSVKLIHDKNNDSCRSIVTKTIEIDLKNIAYDQTPGSEIVFMLEGWDDQLKYTFE